MTDLQKRGERLLRENPALRNPEWLPRGLWPELDDMHDRHQAILQQMAEETDCLVSLQRRYEAEDAARTESFQRGGLPPTTTPEAERQNEVATAKARIQGSHAALAACVAEAIDLIQTKHDEWRVFLDELKSQAASKRAEAKRLLEEANQDAWTAKRSHMWLDRTAMNKPMRHIAYAHLSGPVPPNEALRVAASTTGSAPEKYVREESP